jgi:hypothetical protein
MPTRLEIMADIQATRRARTPGPLVRLDPKDYKPFPSTSKFVPYDSHYLRGDDQVAWRKAMADFQAGRGSETEEQEEREERRMNEVAERRTDEVQMEEMLDAEE